MLKSQSNAQKDLDSNLVGLKNYKHLSNKTLGLLFNQQHLGSVADAYTSAVPMFFSVQHISATFDLVVLACFNSWNQFFFISLRLGVYLLRLVFSTKPPR